MKLMKDFVLSYTSISLVFASNLAYASLVVLPTTLDTRGLVPLSC